MYVSASTGDAVQKGEKMKEKLEEIGSMSVVRNLVCCVVLGTR